MKEMFEDQLPKDVVKEARERSRELIDLSVEMLVNTLKSGMEKEMKVIIEVRLSELLTEAVELLKKVNYAYERDYCWSPNKSEYAELAAFLKKVEGEE